MTGGIYGKKPDSTSVRNSTYVSSNYNHATKIVEGYNISLFSDNNESQESEVTKISTSGQRTLSQTDSYVPGTTQRGQDLTNTARNYLNEGHQEYTQDEIDIMKQNGQDVSHTQDIFLKPFLGIGSGNNRVTEDSSWCAAFVNRVAHDTGLLEEGQNYCGVQQFINWGKRKGTYHEITTNTTRTDHLDEDRSERAAQITKQLPSMKSGDFIIWKSPRYQIKTDSGIKNEHSSHIGIIESVDRKKGTVTVIEGNANINRSDSQNERYVVHNAAQGAKGNQSVGELQEVNQRDGLIRKTYTIEDLARFGYSGFINNN